MIRKVFITALLITGLFLTKGNAQSISIIQYINTYKYIAIQEMQRTGIPASIKLAQGILETQAGTSDLVMRSNNHFGIKCKTGWAGNKVYHDDDERGECFRAYASAEDSYRDHSDFLKNSQRYAFLFQLNPENYEGWARGLKKAGYATNPKYTQIVIKYIEDYNLQLYTLVALGKKSIEEEDRMYAAVSGANPVIPARVLVPVENSFSKEPAASEQHVMQPFRVQYPLEEFKINDTKVIVAIAGSSLLAIADQYGIKYKHLLDFNELPEDAGVLQKDQLIFLQRKRKQGEKEFHLVEKGETLYDISQKEGIRLENLMDYNHLQAGEEPATGQRLSLQKKIEGRIIRQAQTHITGPELLQFDVISSDGVARATVKHVVQNKETLFSIARKYEIQIEDLRSWNKLEKNDIRTGQELLIYKN